MYHSATFEAPGILHENQHDLGVWVIEGAVFFDYVDVFGSHSSKKFRSLYEGAVVIREGCQEKRSESDVVDTFPFPLRDTGQEVV